MSVAPQHKYASVDEYLAGERAAREKHEYRDGEILLMAGGTADHSLIIANVIGELRNLLKGKPCRVYDSNLRVRSNASFYTYPDITVICGPRTSDPNDKTGETVTNPKLIVEVLSPTTEGYDRGEKFTRYRQIGTLEEYVLITPTTPHVEIFSRPPERSPDATPSFLFTWASGIEAAAFLRSLDLRLPLAEVYRGVEFPPPAQA